MVSLLKSEEKLIFDIYTYVNNITIIMFLVKMENYYYIYITKR